MKLEVNCELRGTDNVQGQLFVHITEAKSSSLSLLSFKYFLSQRKQRRETKLQKKTRSKIRRLFVAFWHCFLNKFPNFLTSKLKENAPFRSLFARRGLLAVSGHYRLITSAHERTLLGHASGFHQSRAKRNIWWIIKRNINTWETTRVALAFSRRMRVLPIPRVLYKEMRYVSFIWFLGSLSPIYYTNKLLEGSRCLIFSKYQTPKSEQATKFWNKAWPVSTSSFLSKGERLLL